jgi:hypothetical protein
LRKRLQKLTCFASSTYKTHCFYICSESSKHKTHCFHIKSTPKDPKSWPKSLKTHTPAHKNTLKKRTRTPLRNSDPRGPATGRYSHSRPPAASPRSHDTKRKRRRNEADLPVTGGCHKGELTPLNLRYIYIYIYIYMYT